MKKLSHIDGKGHPVMVDVSGKKPQFRIAKSRGAIKLAPATIEQIREDGMKKGNVLVTAEIAGIQAAKRTPELIPLCHPLPLSKIEVRCSLGQRGVEIQSEVGCIGRTGVEMEALTAVSVALLTVYDMCKAVDKEMEITDIVLVEKTKNDL